MDAAFSRRSCFSGVRLAASNCAAGRSRNWEQVVGIEITCSVASFASLPGNPPCDRIAGAMLVYCSWRRAKNGTRCDIGKSLGNGGGIGKIHFQPGDNRLLFESQCLDRSDVMATQLLEVEYTNTRNHVAFMTGQIECKNGGAGKIVVELFDADGERRFDLAVGADGRSNPNVACNAVMMPIPPTWSVKCMRHETESGIETRWAEID